MFESIFGGDLNGQGMYDCDWDYAEGEGQGQSFGPSPDWICHVDVIEKRESVKAKLFTFLVRDGVNLLGFTEKWIPKSQIHSLVEYDPKHNKEKAAKNIKSLRIKGWLFDKIIEEFRQRKDWKNGYKLGSGSYNEF